MIKNFEARPHVAMSKDKKGQAAMEFLMTYGWAILAAVIVVGVLWYLIGSPSNLAGTQFQVSAPLIGEGVVINTNLIQLNIKNGAGEAINITEISLTDESTSCPDNTTGSAGGSIAVGDEYVLNVACTTALTSGDRFNSDVVIKYTEGTSSTFERQATGTVSGKVP